MIDILSEIINNLDTIPAVREKVLREYPASDGMALPFVVVGRTGYSTILSDDSGEQILAQVTYTARVYGRTSEEAENIGESVIKLNNHMGINTIGCASPVYSSQNHAYYQTLTFSATVDKRGATFR